MTNKCFSASCQNDALDNGVLCAEHYEKLPAPMRGEQAPSKERFTAEQQIDIQNMARAICGAWPRAIGGCVNHDNGCGPRNCSIWHVALAALRQLGELPPAECDCPAPGTSNSSVSPFCRIHARASHEPRADLTDIATILDRYAQWFFTHDHDPRGREMTKLAEQLRAAQPPLTARISDLNYAWFEAEIHDLRQADRGAGITPVTDDRQLAKCLADAVSEHFAIHRAAQPPSHEWQPIETAPKDGTPILGFVLPPRMQASLEGPRVVKWSGEYGMWSMPGISGLTCSHWLPVPSGPTKPGEQP